MTKEWSSGRFFSVFFLQIGTRATPHVENETYKTEAMAPVRHGHAGKHKISRINNINIINLHIFSSGDLYLCLGGPRIFSEIFTSIYFYL